MGVSSWGLIIRGRGFCSLDREDGQLLDLNFSKSTFDTESYFRPTVPVKVQSSKREVDIQKQLNVR